MATGEVARRIDEAFLKELQVDDTVVNEVLFVLHKNQVINVANLCSLSKDELKSLRAKNDKGEELALGAGTVGVLWKFIEKRGTVTSSVARTDYVNVSKEVAQQLVGDPLSVLPRLDELTERLERDVPCCFPEEAIFVASCRDQYRYQREAEISIDPSSFMFVTTSADRRVNPSTLSVRPVLVDATSVIENKSEDAVHAVLTPLIQFFVGGLMKLLGFSWFSPSGSFARNEAEPKRSRTTTENLRPDWMFFIYKLLVMRGKEKGSSSAAKIDEVSKELIQKMDTWHTLFFGELPYVFGYASCGTRIQFYAMHPDRSLRRTGGACGVLLTKIGKELELTYLDERFRLLKYMINLVRVFESMEPLIPRNAPPLGRDPVSWKRHHSGEYSEIVFEPGFVIKTLCQPPTGKVRYDFPTLAELYKVIKDGKIRFSIQCKAEYPKMYRNDVMRLHLFPIGLPIVPRDKATLKACLSNVLCALEDLHGQGFCHRDVRWPNILRNIDDSWMLIDFDFAAKLKRGKAEWPTWARGVPARMGSESWSAKHDILQVAMLLDDELTERLERDVPCCWQQLIRPSRASGRNDGGRMGRNRGNGRQMAG